jgi:hypothetical protein
MEKNLKKSKFPCSFCCCILSKYPCIYDITFCWKEKGTTIMQKISRKKNIVLREFNYLMLV